jgi:hypothetical protein
VKRLVLSALVLFACTKARTSEPPSAGSAHAPAPAAPAAPAVPDSFAASSPTPDASTTRPTPPPKADVHGGVGAEAIPGPEVVSSGESPGAALSKQIRGSSAPAQGGRSLVVVKSKTALDTSSLKAGKLAFQFVSRGQASVTRCFEEQRAKDPAAKGLLTLRFAVDVHGAVVDAQVEGFNSEVASCVQAAMPTWTFSAPDKRTRFELVLDLVIG